MALKRHENEARRPPFTSEARSRHPHPGGYKPLMTVVNTGGRECVCVYRGGFFKVL